MPVYEQAKHEQGLRETLTQVSALLDKQDLVHEVALRQATQRQDLVEALVAKQQLVELQKKLKQLHPADVAFVLEGLPLERREKVWDLIEDEQRGAVLLELSDVVREHLLGEMQESEIVEVAEHLDSDEIADLAFSLPRDTVIEILNSLDREDREEVQTALAFPEGTVGALMDFELVTVRDDVQIDVVLRYLRKRGGLPERADQLFVVDRTGVLRGVLPIKDLLFHDPESIVAEVMVKASTVFSTGEPAGEAVYAFERYDLITAPVVNLHNHLVGVLSVDTVMDYMNELAQRERLIQAGLAEEEDIFAPIWKSGRNRWAWLAINLMTAFIASSVINAFAGTIEKLVALAVLMPIVASVGGNTGNQTVALVIRGLALNQINSANVRHLLFKEIGVAIMNGLVWGVVVGLFAYLLYFKFSLALVMMGAMVLNLLLASLSGVLIPLSLQKLGRDPVLGSSVMLTAITDSMGFFIFLGLAAFFLQ